MVEAAIAAAGAAAYTGLSDLWSYNRDNYFFNENLRQMRLHQEQNIRVAKAQLHREDLRDLFGLTVTKMDCHTTVNTLMLGFCLTLFYDGRLSSESSSWLFWLHALSTVGAFIYLTLSLWFAIYTSIAAQSYSVRALTARFRLNAADAKEIDSARGYAAEYELNLRAALRLPFIMGSREPKAGADGDDLPDTEHAGLEADETIADLEQDHIKMFCRLQGRWRGYDSHTRACMNLGICHVFQVMVYYTYAYFLEVDALMAFIYVASFITAEWLAIWLDFVLSSWEFAICLLLVILGPACAAASLNPETPSAWATRLETCAFVAHFLKLSLLLFEVSLKHPRTLLPIKLRGVLYLNVFGRMQEEPECDSDDESDAKNQVKEKQAERALAHEGRLERWLELWGARATRETQLGAKEIAIVDSVAADFGKNLARRRAALPGQIPRAQGMGESPEGGWIRFVYRGQGGEQKCHWFNALTQKTSWEKPSGTAVEAPDLDALQSLSEAYGADVHRLVELAAPRNARESQSYQDALPRRLFWIASLSLLTLWAIAGLAVFVHPVNGNKFTMERRLATAPEAILEVDRSEALAPSRRGVELLARHLGLPGASAASGVVAIDTAALRLARLCLSRRSASDGGPSVRSSVDGADGSRELRRSASELSAASLRLARRLAARLRNEADLGDGALGRDELELWRLGESAASAEAMDPCDPGSEAAAA
eukprot:TRINITY_DN15194_c0_g1_i1.p1 TRINITY_DN15194_c0_g1~~TRINITY_DN15194_c0_g1_i1.p1  ORF type:complete len:757 (-),score=151.14 TRINITY_DN15194_c0_g1_i1:94-2232(-)